MIPVTDQALFQEALDCLVEHKRNVGRTFKGRFIQIFLGLKYFQSILPSMFSGSYVPSEVLQGLLDDVYSKSSRPPNQSVLSLFEGSFLARTGLRAPGNLTAQNTWRNNLNLQKGIGCYAEPEDLASRTFLDQDRTICRHLRPVGATALGGAHCALCFTNAQYRGEGHRKWLKIDRGGNGYAIIDLQMISNYISYVAPQNQRIPLIPLIVALYHDADPSLVLGNRNEVELAHFMTDFNFSDLEVTAYFDTSATHPINARMMHGERWPAGAALGAPLALQPNIQIARKQARPRAVPTTPVLTGTPVPPPAVNTGWEAEQFVRSALATAGWNAHVVSRQQLGYDILAVRGRYNLYVEVKSSLGQCSPILTSREWQQASIHADNYVLAVIENFNPERANTVYWIQDPAHRCVAIGQVSIEHRIARGSWVFASVPLDQLAPA